METIKKNMNAQKRKSKAKPNKIRLASLKLLNPKKENKMRM